MPGIPGSDEPLPDREELITPIDKKVTPIVAVIKCYVINVINVIKHFFVLMQQ